MRPDHLIFQDMTFGYESSPVELFRSVSFHISNGWCGVIGANGSGKSTLMKLATGLLIPDRGSISRPQRAIYCPQRTDEPPDSSFVFIDDRGKDSQVLKSKLEIGEDYQARWQTLSHGERKRLQLGVALWLQPDLLAIDEPTNHLDAHACNLIVKALQMFEGIGLLVSHDRELLDRLCQVCLYAFPPAVILKPGGATQAMAAVEQEKMAIQRQYDNRKKELQKLYQETVRRREEAQRADRKRSKRHLDRKDHDGRAKMDRARVTGKDGHAGKLQRQLQGRLDRQRDEFTEIRPEKKYDLGIWLPAESSQRAFLLRMPAGFIHLGGDKKLTIPELNVKPADRIAITGANGAGKSTLVRHLLGHFNADPARITYLPQEIDRHASKAILDEVLSLSKSKLGQLMTIVSRLGTRPERLFSSNEPSPGEARKLLLALGMSRQPQVIVMDEPTNHLDLPSIRCLEDALAQCPCALMLVSHDLYFLRRLTTINWELAAAGDGESFVLQN